MRYFILTTLLLANAAALVSTQAEDAKSVELPQREDFHLFLLAGQSNMAGRGKVAAEDKKIHPRVLALTKDGKWAPAVDPIHYDKSVAGVGLAKSFAIAMAQQHADITIGLIPAACGGSPIASWQPGGYHGQTKSHPYDDAIKRSERAMKDGVLKAVLWHQGESDSTEKRAPSYKKNLGNLIDRFRKDLHSPSLPFVIGQLGQFPEKPWNNSRKLINEAHSSVAKEKPFVAFVSSDELTCKADKVHFNSKSLREFGRRYKEAYVKTVEASQSNPVKSKNAVGDGD